MYFDSISCHYLSVIFLKKMTAWSKVNLSREKVYQEKSVRMGVGGRAVPPLPVSWVFGVHVSVGGSVTRGGKLGPRV